MLSSRLVRSALLAAGALLTLPCLAAPGAQTVVPVASPTLRALAAAAPRIGLRLKEVENHERPPTLSFARRAAPVDPAVQTVLPQPRLATVAGLDFAGIGQADYGYGVDSVPPDATGAVGATQYVQWVNTALAVFDKASGALVSGPIDGNQLFSALGATHPCARTNDGDPLVLFDRRAQRWVLSQFAVENPFYQCVAVSQTADATGAYWLYAFRQPRFNDYGKLGIWLDGYYIAYNMFNVDDSYAGVRVCAMKRAAMLAGRAAREVCLPLGTAHYSLLPADVDGVRQPARGTPEYLIEIDYDHPDSLAVFRFHADFATPANSTLTGPLPLAVAPYTLPCNPSNCVYVQQPGVAQKLDSLGDRLMYRFAYRRVGAARSFVVNHAVATPTGVGLRWYELRPEGDGLRVQQQSTFAPEDGTASRWMGSIAMDKLGNIAMGYSAADNSSGVFPSIRYTGRLATDRRNTMQAENTLIEGTGAQKSFARWGDYSTMSVDPVDDCTFWFTSQYLNHSGSFNWHTRVASFRFPGCS